MMQQYPIVLATYLSAALVLIGDGEDSVPLSRREGPSQDYPRRVSWSKRRRHGGFVAAESHTLQNSEEKVQPLNRFGRE